MSDIRDLYFEWLISLINNKRKCNFRKLLTRLHQTTFKCKLRRDLNRCEDGVDLRYRYSLEHEPEDFDILNEFLGRCSILEMMVGLAVRCEEQIMDDPKYGNRTGQWFWEMVVSLGLGYMSDDRYDKNIVDEILDIFMKREYEPNGKGGLFTIENGDLRDVEIWYQMCWYLDSLI